MTCRISRFQYRENYIIVQSQTKNIKQLH